VLKRKISGPTRSLRGDQFLARGYTVHETCLRQGVDLSGSWRATARISVRASWMRSIASAEPSQPKAARRKRERNAQGCMKDLVVTGARHPVARRCAGLPP
jgi:hypothetical protein